MKERTKDRDRESERKSKQGMS